MNNAYFLIRFVGGSCEEIHPVNPSAFMLGGAHPAGFATPALYTALKQRRLDAVKIAILTRRAKKAMEHLA
jgi:hypothetical protein